MNFHPNARSADLGKPAAVTPSPSPVQPADKTTASEGGPTGYAGHSKTPQYPASRLSLAMDPSFASISRTISGQLERDERERRAVADAALGIAPKSPEQDLHDRLAKAVTEGSLTSDEATQYFKMKFPSVPKRTA